MLATWAYDTATNGLGLAASSTAKITPPGGSLSSYTKTITGYTDDGLPTGTTWSVPPGYGLTGTTTYTESYGYDPAGHLTTLAAPAINGLPAETLTAGWTDYGRPSTLTSSYGGTVVAATSFDNLGRLTGRRWNNTSSGPQRAYGYDNLDRLTSAQTKTGSAATVVQNDAYTYSGVNLTRVTDQVSGQRECYAYDDVRRLAHAWTTNADCTDAASPNRTFGPGPYDQKWTFDTDNDIVTFSDAAASGGTSSTTYSGYGTAGKPAHAATTATTTGSGAGTAGQGFDASGYLTTSTPSSGSAQTLTWDNLHQLTSSVTGTAATRFAYDADGTRIVRQTPTGTTLSLGISDLVYPASGTATGRRTITLDGAAVAVGLSDGAGNTSITYISADDQASTDISIDPTTQALTRTRYTPYGKIRATTGTLGTLGTGLPTDKSFLGKTYDASTGLNDLGARYYQAGSGVFTAPDPIADPTNPRTTSPYTYAYGNPVAASDPSGLEAGSWCEGPSSSQCQKDANNHQTNDNYGGNKPSNPGYHGGCGNCRSSGDGSGGSGGGGHHTPPPCGRYCPFLNTSNNSSTGRKITFSDVLGFASQLVGVQDAKDCFQDGSISGCAWTATNVAVVLKPLRFLKIGDEALEAAKTAETADGAANVANEVRLRAQLTGEQISSGHAFADHVVKAGEFPGITTRQQFASRIEDVVMNGESRQLLRGRTAYWEGNTVVIRDPASVDGGTAFVPTGGYNYFLGLK